MGVSSAVYSFVSRFTHIMRIVQWQDMLNEH